MPESQNIEWKQSWRDEYLKWICGFANANGGTIFIGKDNRGEVVGLDKFQKLMEDIPSKITNHLGIVSDVNLHEKDGKRYIEIITYPYDVPISYHGAYHYRSGSTKQELTGAALNEFLLRKAGKTWDDVIEPSATWEDIDEGAIEAFKKAAIKSNRLPGVMDDNTEELLTNLRLYKNGQFKRAALLLFGKDPKTFFPTAYLKIGKFGKDDADLQFQDVIECNAFEMADKTIEILERKYLTRPISYEGLHRVENAEYPFEAVREVLLNAIIHRRYASTPIQVSLYDDRLMVWNEGKLPEELTVEMLKTKHPSLLRNPILAETCFKGGLIEAWGRGTLRVINECIKFGLPEPGISTIGGGLAFIIYKEKPKDVDQFGLNERQSRAIAFLRKNHRITNKEYQDLNQVSRKTATRDLSELVEKGILLSSGQKGVGSFYTLNGIAS